jgi:hypothetical protein
MVLLVDFTRLVRRDCLTPEKFSVDSIHRERKQLSLFRRREEDAVAPDTRRRKAGGHFDFPEQVGVRTELDGWLVILSDPGRIGPVKLGPVDWGGGKRGGGNQEKGEHK